MKDNEKEIKTIGKSLSKAKSDKNLVKERKDNIVKLNPMKEIYKRILDRKMQ